MLGRREVTTVSICDGRLERVDEEAAFDSDFIRAFGGGTESSSSRKFSVRTFAEDETGLCDGSLGYNEISKSKRGFDKPG